MLSLHKCHQQIYYKLRNGGGGGGGYSVLINYQLFLSNLFSLAPSQLFFSLNGIRNRLLRVSFIDFIIYQHLNKRTNILPLATSQIAHLCHQFNHVCIANCNCNYILFTKLPWPGDSEWAFRFSSQAATCPPVYLTLRRLHTVPFNAERQAGKL